jgi:hypothetical protein
VQRPGRKRIRLRSEQNPSPDGVPGRDALQQGEPVGQQRAAVGSGATERSPFSAPPAVRRTACSGARFSELKRAFGADANNGTWWDGRGGAGLEYLSGRGIESFPLLRPLPEAPLSEPGGEVLCRLIGLFEAELVKRMPNGITCNVAACVDAEHAVKGASNGSTAFLCGHIDNFCQKLVRFAFLTQKTGNTVCSCDAQQNHSALWFTLSQTKQRAVQRVAEIFSSVCSLQFFALLSSANLDQQLWSCSNQMQGMAVATATSRS